MVNALINNRDELKSFIVREVVALWGQDRQAYALTTLGNAIRRNLTEGLYIRSLAPKGLKQFIESEMNGLVKTIPDTGIDGKFGAVPADVEIPDNTAHLFKAGVTIDGTKVETPFLAPRYHYGFWNAFRQPLP
jgi:hypothetical protein